MNKNSDPSLAIQTDLTTGQNLAIRESEPSGKPNRLGFDELLGELQAYLSRINLQNEDLQQALSSLEKIKDHYVDLYDNAPVGYLTVDEAGKVIETNLVAARLLGNIRQHIIRQHFIGFVDDKHKDLWASHFDKAKTSNGKYGCELPFADSQGKTKYYHLDCLIAKTEKKQPCIRITLTDVTQRKESDTALRIAAAAFESQESIIVTDANRVILQANKAFTRITGYSSEEAIGKTPALLSSGLHPEGFYDNLLAIVARDGYWQGEIWNKRKNGEIFPVFQTITKVTNNIGEITHYVGAMVDITAQKQAEKILLEARNRLQGQVMETQEELEKTRAGAIEINTALNVLLKHREKDKNEAQIALSNEVEAIVMPLLNKLKGTSNRRIESLRMIDLIEDNLNNLMKSYGRANHLDAAYNKLTPIETQVAAMVKLGKPSKVIANTLNISVGTVNIHRKHIRKKLGLDNSTNLQSFMQSLTDPTNNNSDQNT